MGIKVVLYGSTFQANSAKYFYPKNNEEKIWILGSTGSTFGSMKPKRQQTKESFLKKVRIKSSGCWHFTGAINTTGYGVVGFKGKVWQAHRLSYYFHNGAIPDGLMVLHKCDNRRCVNPDHLFLGTAKDNTQDMINKGRWVCRKKQTHCRKGHELTEENTMVNKTGRTCRKCHNTRQLIYSQKRKTTKP